jgi:hypothetical protein
MIASWTPFISRLITTIASYASIFGVIVTIQPNLTLLPAFGKFLLLLATAATVISLSVDIQEFSRNRKRVYRKSSERIIKYMHKWIDTGGRCAIFTRDMTWTTNEDIRNLLIRKSRNHELWIFMPSPTQFALELEQHGAKIINYANIEVVPRSRFTVIHWGQDGARVAVGRPQGNLHEISEYEIGKDPIYSVIEDLLEILAKMAKHSGQKQ